jgi:hypothetical protein
LPNLVDSEPKQQKLKLASLAAANSHKFAAPRDRCGAFGTSGGV